MIPSAESLPAPVFHTTHCALRLGDNLAHLHFLRKLAEANAGHRFIHFCHLDYFNQLQPVIYDQPRIALLPFTSSPASLSRWSASPPGSFESIDAWKNAGGFWQGHSLRSDYSAFMLEWFDHIASRMELASPLKRPKDLLFDYPALNRPLADAPKDHILFVNSQPMSGQLPGIGMEALDALGLDLADSNPTARIITTSALSQKRLNVTCTQDLGFSVTTIGRLSCYARHIVMVATGPSWTTFNLWSAAKVDKRVVLCEESLDGIPASQTCATFARILPAREYLRSAGILKP